MVGEPPSGPTRANRRRDLTELRIANLRRELDAETDPRSQAAILYEVGILQEHDLVLPEEASASYQQAADVDPLFQPPLMARLRLAERKPNGASIEAICDALTVASQTETLRASALVDLALRSDDWADLLREAIRVAPNGGSASLLLEWLAGEHDDPNARRDALRAQAIAATDPALRGALWLEVGIASLELGEIDESLEALTEATKTPETRLHAHSLAVRVAREQERWFVFDREAPAFADALEAAAADSDAVDPLSLPMPLEHALPMATLLRSEAAARKLESLQDPRGALALFDEALRLKPDDLGTRLHTLVAAETAEDERAIDEAGAWFREHHPDHPGYLAHCVRRAVGSADVESARAALAEVQSKLPQSQLARAALDVATIRAQAVDARIETLQRRADGPEPKDRTSTWRAAHLAAEASVHDADAHALYDDAARIHSGDAETVERESLGAALFARRWDRVVSCCTTLLERDLDFDERAIVGYCKYEALKRGVGEVAARSFLAEAVDVPAHQRWAPAIGRARAAWCGDLPMLARAHEALAATTSGQVRVGHLCAVAQTYARQERWDECEEALRRALDESPDDPYALSLLEGVMRESGRPEAAVSLASQRSKSSPGTPIDEVSLLLAGASAERNGNLPAARHAYETALRSSPTSPSAALALLDIARAQDDRGARIRALDALARADLDVAEPERFSVLHGDALLEADRAAEAADAFEDALEHEETALHAAIGLLVTPARATTEAQRHAAQQTIAARAALPDEQSAFGDAYASWRESLTTGVDGAAVWFRWSESAPDDRVRATTLLQGLRNIAVTRGSDTADDAFLKAQEAAPLAKEEPLAAIVLDEALSPSDDAEFRAGALAHRLVHAGRVGLNAQRSAYWRALVDAGRGADAVKLLTDALDRRPDDLALWETLRSAARQAGDWPLVALCCDRLAHFVEGSLRADLLEESGVVRLDALGQERQAEDSFRAALAEDPTREVSFRRLHDLLTAREDADGLQDLVAERLAEGGGDGREDLLYERARLLRGFSERDEALEVLEELLEASPEHPGALALTSEIFVSLERWAEAVDSLRRLAAADIPADQRRIAHLGAGDFLENHLGRPTEALVELRAVDDLGLLDARILVRIGGLEETCGNQSDAAVAYGRALEIEPTSREAAAGIARTEVEPTRDRALASFEQAIWNRIATGVLEEAWLVDLRDAASWRQQPRRAAAGDRVLDLLGTEMPRTTKDTVAPVFAAVASDDLADDLADTSLRRMVAEAGPVLEKQRLRLRNKVPPGTPLLAQLDRLCGMFDTRVGVVATTSEANRLAASLNRQGQLDWLLPSTAMPEIDGPGLFRAGRLAWITSRGGGALLETTTEQAAGKLAAIARAAKVEVTSDMGGVPRVEAKLPRTIRKTVNELIGDRGMQLTTLFETARWFQQSADRAGLLACEDIGVALRGLLGRDRVTLDTLQASSRAIDLLRFWLDDRSALWRHHG